ncbi:MAG: hypothetical protein ACYTFK_04775 [Planctomycetota bacterium]|jgi:hypothetical protein
MVKRVQCRVLDSVSLKGPALCAGGNLSSWGEPEPTEPDIAGILKSIRNIKNKMHNRSSIIEHPKPSIHPVPLGSIIDLVA